MVVTRDAKYGISTATKAEDRAAYLDAGFESDERADQSTRTDKVRVYSPPPQLFFAETMALRRPCSSTGYLVRASHGRPADPKAAVIGS